MANETTSEGVQMLKAHLALNVRSVAQGIVFYKKIFGLEPSKVRAGYAKFDIQNPPLNLTLNEHAFTGRGALSHMGIQVASTADVLAMREKWIKAGLATRDEMQTNCCYATQDKTWVADPDGNQWEVFVVLQDNLPETDHNSTCCASNTVEPKEVQAASETAPSCACESTPPPVNQAACCDTQAAKFGITGVSR